MILHLPKWKGVGLNHEDHFIRISCLHITSLVIMKNCLKQVFILTGRMSYCQFATNTQVV